MSAIWLQGVGKRYPLYSGTRERLRELFSGQPPAQQYIALQPLDLRIERGEVVGIIGRNGAGKSTLLKLISGTLLPSSGQMQVNGQISALLELGTGFHPDLTGRDNVYLGGAVKGLTSQQIDALYPQIVEFSGLSDFMQRPVKTYSSGMLMRLAFALATCIEPDILIIDEALSVGDAAFAQKSFDRIMGFKRTGKTILFCSHSMYQVEAICNRVLWLHDGQIRLQGEPAEVVTAYSEYLDSLNALKPPVDTNAEENVATSAEHESAAVARILELQVSVDGQTGRLLEVHSQRSDVQVRVRFQSQLSVACPRVAITLTAADGRAVTSCGNWQDGLEIVRDAQGIATVQLRFPQLPLLKGSYWVNVFLLSHEGVLPYERVAMVAELRVQQQGLEQGIVALPHQWQQLAS